MIDKINFCREEGVAANGIPQINLKKPLQNVRKRTCTEG